MICSRCGKEFIVVYTEGEKKKSFKTCEKCRERSRAAQRRYKQNKCIKRVEADVPKSHLADVVHEIEVYNREHGTRLTYGKYKVLKDRGLI